MKFATTMKTALSCAAILLAAGCGAAAGSGQSAGGSGRVVPDNCILASPGDAAAVSVYLDPGNVLRVMHDDAEVFRVNLGIKSDKANYDFGELKLAGTSPSGKDVLLVTEKYTSVNGKRSERNVRMNEKTLVFADARGENKIGVVLRAGDNAFAFRYSIGGARGTEVEFQGESTKFTFPLTDGFRMQRRVTSYEDRYNAYTADQLKPQQPRQGGQGGPGGPGGFGGGRGGRGPNRNWNYPLLFNSADKSTWGLLSETWFDGTYCGTYLQSDVTDDGVTFTTHYPDQGEGANQGAVNPTTTLPWQSPWRCVVIGTLADIVESTLVDDLAPACAVKDVSWITPGIASWVYWAYNNGSKDYQIVKDYILLASEMKWPNVLIDWEWDVMRNGGNIDDALALAKEKNVGVWLWYNSGGKHNYVGGGPRDRFNTHESREKEFAWLNSKNVKGVKIDFFESDKQSMMQYYVDILKDAAPHKVMVNFHGSTLPRGWSRTYPNLMSMESVWGAEQYNNHPMMTDPAAEHNTTLPFTRNAVGPMDYTPTAFTNSQHAHRTSHAHELALPVVFESAAQHMADRPSAFRALPDKVKDFIAGLPTTWDDTKYLGGEPGDFVILGRRKGSTWYVGGINGKAETREIKFTVPGKAGETFSYRRIADGKDVDESFFHEGKVEPGDARAWDITEGTAKAGDELTVRMVGRGGFVFRFEKK